MRHVYPQPSRTARLTTLPAVAVMLAAIAAASCEGTGDDLDVSSGALTVTKRTRGSNSQVVLPNKLALADIDGDGNADFVQATGPRLFASKTNFNRTGILHKYFTHDIKTVITGDFKGIGRDYVCATFDDNYLRCYKGSDGGGQELWWTWSQGNFIAAAEDVIVGDYDGNGKDDLLLYNRTTGAIRFYAVDASGVFGPLGTITLGNLASMQKPGLQFRVGDFHGDGRDDLLVYDGSGRVYRYSSAVDNGANTFWYAFVTNTGVVGANDEISLARIDNDEIDDVVIRNRTSGAISFFLMQYQAGLLRPLTGVSKGQLPVRANGVLAWTWNKATSGEPGADKRDDTLYLGGVDRISTKARWNGSQYTYSWDYSRGLPTDHTGWAAKDARKWLVLKCKLSNVTAEPNDNTYYRWLFADQSGDDNLVAYFRDISFGTRNMAANVVDDVWHTTSVNETQFQALSRPDRMKKCLAAAGNPDLTAYRGAIAVWNSENADVTGWDGRVMVEFNKSLMTIAHEVAHGEGFSHSWDDTANGEYKDPWDISGIL